VPTALLAGFLTIAAAVLSAASTAWAQAATPDEPDNVGRITTEIDDLRKLGLSVTAALLTAAALVLLPYVVWRLVRTRRTIQLIVDDVKDGSGDPALKDRLGGLSQVFREEVAAELLYVAVEARRTIDLARLEGVRLSRQPLAPRTAPDVTAQALAESLSGLASEPGKPVVDLLGRILLRPRGTRVVTTLQRRGSSSDQVGISFGIVDLRDEGIPEQKTVWEPRQAWPMTGSRGRVAQAGDGAATAVEDDVAPGHRLAATLRAVADDLAAIGQLDDAVAHLGDALHAAQLSKASGEVDASLLAINRVGGKLAVQSQAGAAFALGRRLEDADRRGEAVDAYVAGLPLPFQAVARTLWSAALSSAPRRSAPSLHTLARLYQERAYAWAESRELLMRAEKLGLADAQQERTRLAATEARALARAARSLLRLARYDGAKTIAERCLGIDPTNEVAQAVQAAVLRARPPQDEEGRETVAHLALARIYLQARQLDDAEKELTAALSSSPDLAEASAGLKEVLATRKPLDQRVSDLIRPTVAFLALELLRRELTAKQTKRFWRRVAPITAIQEGIRRVRDDDACRNEGLIRNYIGMLLQGRKSHPVLGLLFLNDAIKELKFAVRLIPSFYQPHENLADTYIFKAKHLLADEKVHEAHTNIRLGIEHYRMGLRVLEASTLKDKPEGLTAQRLLRTDLAIALMMPGPTQDLPAARCLMSEAMDCWKAGEETHARVLPQSGVGVWRLLIAEGESNQKVLDCGRGLLAHAMARDAFRWYWNVEDDPDLKLLIQDLDAEALRSALRTGDPCLYRREPGVVVAAVEVAVTTARWPAVSIATNQLGGPL